MNVPTLLQRRDPCCATQPDMRMFNTYGNRYSFNRGIFYSR